MIRGVWVINQGVPIVVRTYAQLERDETLIGGMLEALSSFALEVSKDEIKEVLLKNQKFAFLRKDVLIVVNADVSTPFPVLLSILNKIYEIFKKEGSITAEKVDEIINSPVVKIVFLGEGGVGKTTLRLLLTGKKPPTQYLPTIGAPGIEVVDLEGMKISIWDFPGQEKYRNSWPFFLKQTDIVFFVTDSTLDNVLATLKMMEGMKDSLKDKVVFAIANKQDLPTALNPISIEEILKVKTFPSVATDPTYRPYLLKIIENATYIALGYNPKERMSIEDLYLRFTEIETKVGLLEKKIDEILKIIKNLKIVDEKILESR
ncbi:MAG: ADP-ribosylation factor-like protein [Candidatus Asgardarchaeia archaeon]